jgi:hypothetical protein
MPVVVPELNSELSASPAATITVEPILTPEVVAIPEVIPEEILP